MKMQSKVKAKIRMCNPENLESIQSSESRAKKLLDAGMHAAVAFLVD